MTNDPLSKYQTDALFLPVGFNPLPNYVAGMLLTKPESTVYLLYSRGKDDGKIIESSWEAAKRVEKALRDKKKELKVFLIDVEESDKTDIEKKVRGVLTHPKFPRGRVRVGVNYTGGTKPMATHAYRTIEQFAQNWSEKPVFSYLDPRELALRIEIDATTDFIRVIQHPEVKLDIEGLLRIHDCKFKKNGINHEIKYSELARAIAEVHSTKSGFASWKEWLNPLQGRLTALPPSTDANLKPVWAALQNICEGRVTLEVLADKLSPENCASWLSWKWLENYAFEALSNSVKKILGSEVLPTLYCGKNLKAERSDSPDYLELDLAAVLGYQFFAISCKAGQLDKREAKLALFEAYVRATQLGGDEARAGLVCCSQSPKTIEDELAEAWDAEGKIKVFGMFDLMRLENRFFDWLEIANKRRIVT
jgi:hypothetical protein